MKKFIVIGNDHNGLDQKNFIKKILNKKFTVIDVGNYELGEKVDYIEPANQLSKIIQDNPGSRGILLCGTGVGMNIVSNKNKNIRSVLAHSVTVAKKSRDHNDSNVICLGTWINDKSHNLKIVSAWLDTQFGEGRHVKRVEKIERLEKYPIAFVNGVFDILHTGHIQLLNFAKSVGKKLVVAINSDDSVRKLKGKNRPINSQIDRKYALLNISHVDEVIIFDENKPTKVIKKIKPSVIVRGDDFKASAVRKRDNIPNYIDIKIFQKIKGYSTTNIINKINDRKKKIK
jgi:rfaE bifunctional protein nucleotidyltransferase chain/domain